MKSMFNPDYESPQEQPNGIEKFKATRKKLLEKNLILEDQDGTLIKYFVENEEKSLDLIEYLQRHKTLRESGTNDDITFLPKKVEGFNYLVQTLKVIFKDSKNSDVNNPSYNTQVQMLSKLFSNNKCAVFFLKDVYDEVFAEWNSNRFVNLDFAAYREPCEEDETSIDNQIRMMGEAIYNTIE